MLQVTKAHHRYHDDPEIKEEGGTPAILGSIRAGLAIQLKEAVGTEWIMYREEQLCRRVFMEWESVDELLVVGPHSIPRLPVFSFLIRHLPSGLYLHHNFVCTLLNDLFGIQARGGCSCAGPYAQVCGLKIESYVIPTDLVKRKRGCEPLPKLLYTEAFGFKKYMHIHVHVHCCIYMYSERIGPAIYTCV